MEKIYDLKIIGYFNDVAKMPDGTGVYFVFARTNKANDDGSHDLRILYIGKAEEGINKRLSNHEKYEDFEGELRNGESLRFAYTLVDTKDCARVESAFIYHCQPPINDSGTDSFNYDKTTIKYSLPSKKYSFFVERLV
ncbi:MAG: hypothetical protein LKM33_03555 [Bacteroidales bacterium]|nr:hypothetical protein [Bacteroidales bacterium]